MKEATRASGGVVSGRRTTRGELGEKMEGLILSSQYKYDYLEFENFPEISFDCMFSLRSGPVPGIWFE